MTCSTLWHLVPARTDVRSFHSRLRCASPNSSAAKVRSQSDGDPASLVSEGSPRDSEATPRSDAKEAEEEQKAEAQKADGEAVAKSEKVKLRLTRETDVKDPKDAKRDRPEEDAATNREVKSRRTDRNKALIKEKMEMVMQMFRNKGEH